MSTASIIPLWSFRFILLLSILVRVALILYSEWHDARSIVKYTDVDYRVFSDAARYVLRPSTGNKAAGPLKELLGWNITIGDPYTRETYRYTPLLALLITPNEWLHPSFGKYLFAACDIFNGILIYKLLLHVILPKTIADASQRERWATIYSAIHLLNPMVFSISTRGSSESILSLLVLLTLFAALSKRWNTAAVMLGVSVHWKIYPFIYGFACLNALRTPGVRYLRSFLNKRTLRLGLLSVSTFAVLTGGCYLIWGYPFLYETYLYHLHRRDHRHNFSPYFYLTYLTYPDTNAHNEAVLPWWRALLRSSLTSFVPQMALAIGTGLMFPGEDNLPFTWLVQTFVFVIFNKVCTSQYFLWYLLLLPLVLPRLQISGRRAGMYIAVWVLTQALWLGEAYKLEFLGQNTFYGLWVRSLIYVAGNCWVIGGIMEGYQHVAQPKRTD
ncbi:GPI mannosyltransferase 1 [Paramarasmius palmivorus]|uniref:GPI mannosyltransferase 1 n=1 Tax=Paramarasmius palmivorus TaxID=297713 RepID=A0AAW0DRQ6_9AGAR